MCFTTILEGCGVKLSTDEAVPHRLTQELPLIRCELRAKLTEETERHDFIQQMKEYLQDDESFTLAIAKTTLHKAKWSSEKLQESIMHLFLTIDQLKPTAMSLLLEKLPHKVIENDIAFVKNALESLCSLNNSNNEDTLAEHLLENLDVAEIAIKMELLHYLPRILSSVSDTIASRLLTLIEENEDLAEAAINCLKPFRYSQKVKMEILIFIFNRLLTSRRYYPIFPSILELLFNCYDDMAQIFDKTRPTMDKIMSSEMTDLKLSLHNILSMETTPCRQVYAAILKSTTPEETKPIDIYLLLLIYINDKLKCKVIDVIIKRKVKGKNFSIDVWESLFDKYFVEKSFISLHSAILDVAISLIESQSPSNVCFMEVGMFIYKKQFAHEFCTDPLRKRMLFKVREVLTYSKSKSIDVYLKMLLDMSKSGMFESYCDNIMPFICLYEKLSPRNMKFIFEIVCENVVKDTNYIDNLQQDITKMLMVWNNTRTKTGVIGAVLLAKYQSLATGTSTSTLNESSMELGNNSHRQAISLLDFTKNKCNNNVASLGLFYDELAMSLNVNTSDNVLSHLVFDVQMQFEKVYVSIEVESNPDQRVPLKVQFDLNAAQEVDQSIFINIGGLLQKQNSSQMKILILPAIFRFLRSVTRFRYQGNMESIDALLGCGVLLPDIEEIDSFGQADLPLVANCLFICINWFRELVSAFVTQANEDIRLKIIQRVEHIILLEDKLEETMAMIPDHKLPQSYFYDEAEAPRSASTSTTKRPRYDTTINMTGASTSGKKSLKKRFYDFREMDNGVMRLLKYPVISAQISTSQAQTLRSKQFQFILRDSICKLGSLMNLRPRAETMNEVTAQNLLRGMEKLMPYVHKQFCLVAMELFTLITNNDEEDSQAFFEPHAVELKISFDLVINLYKLIFSWSGFQLSENRELLNKFLKYFHAAENSSLATQQTQTQMSLDTSTSTNEQKKMFIENMSKYKQRCLVLSSAAALLELLITLRGYMSYQLQEADKIIVETAKVFLKKSWFSLTGAPEHGKEANDHLKLIITAYLNNTNVKTLNGIVNTLTTEVTELKSKKDALQTFQAIDKSNIHIMMKCVCNALQSKLKCELSTQLPIDELSLWNYAVLSLEKLIDVALPLKSHTFLLNLAKTSLAIVNLFQKSGFTTIGMVLKKKPEEVQTLFTNWGSVMRFLHRLACEAVTKRMKAFLSLVPAVRATLEKFVLNVKKVMVNFKCSVAFYEGILTNKNLEGEQILTQNSSTTDLDDEEDELDLFDVDTNLISDAGEQSASEIF